MSSRQGARSTAKVLRYYSFALWSNLLATGISACIFAISVYHKHLDDACIAVAVTMLTLFWGYTSVYVWPVELVLDEKHRQLTIRSRRREWEIPVNEIIYLDTSYLSIFRRHSLEIQTSSGMIVIPMVFDTKELAIANMPDLLSRLKQLNPSFYIYSG